MKLRLGDVLLDVTFGGAAGFRQEAAVLHGSQLLHLGEVPSRAVASVDIPSLLRCPSLLPCTPGPDLLRGASCACETSTGMQLLQGE